MEFDIDMQEMACEPETSYMVNRELNLAWEIIEHTGANLFLTGRAGTGKTTFLTKLRESSSKRMVVLAPTGVAAINAAGTTIHSFFQLPFSPYIPAHGFITDDKKFLKVSQKKKKLISSLSLLVIDEISMVRPDVIDAIDSVLRRIRNSSRPFGGLQLLLIGDLRQLPPVIKEEEWSLLSPHYSSPYFYESHALKAAGYQTVQLSVVYRQTDRTFIDILNKIRNGNADRATLNQLNNRCLPNLNDGDIEGCIRLTTHNYRAALINNSRLDALPAPEFSFEAEISGTFPESSFPAEKVLHLKEGAQVMFIKNDTGSGRRYYNGLIGKVVSISEDCIRVKPTGSGNVIEVEKTEWENTRYAINEETKGVIQETIGTFSQYPLQLAWAITIHKSQGLTFDKAIIDASYSFAPGQTYVALSRCRSLEGLFLDAPIPPRAIITDKEVNEFVAYCEANSPDDSRVSLLKNEYLYSLLSDLFDFEPLRRCYADFSRYTSEYVVPIYPSLDERLKETQQKIEVDLCGVARKFIDSCAKKSIEELTTPDSKLADRISNGCQYFLKILEGIYGFILHVPIDLDNSKYAARLDGLSADLTNIIALHKLILAYFSKNRFSIKSYLDAKAKAILKLEEPLPDKKAAKAKPVQKPKPASISKPMLRPQEYIEPTSKKPKASSKKKPKGYSTFETLRLFRDGKSIPEIAAARNLAESTIASHVKDLIGMDKINIEEVVDSVTIAQVRDIIHHNPDLPFTGILDEINSRRPSSPISHYILSICKGYLEKADTSSNFK